MNCGKCGKPIEMVNDNKAVMLTVKPYSHNIPYSVTIKCCEHIYTSADLIVTYKKEFLEE